MAGDDVGAGRREGMTKDEREELIRLRPENRVSKMEKAPAVCRQDSASGGFGPDGELPGWSSADRILGASCGRD